MADSSNTITYKIYRKCNKFAQALNLTNYVYTYKQSYVKRHVSNSKGVATHLQFHN